MKPYTEYFQDFTGRTEHLHEVIRYRSYPVMFYRTNLATHSKRVAWQVDALLDMFPAPIRATLDEEKIILMAWVHDDHEIIIGDRQSASDWHMSADQFTDLYKREEDAVDKISKLFPKMIGKYIYRDLLLSAVRVDTLESQIVKLADKIEGCNEALHELFAGNLSFAERMIDPDYGKENPHAGEYYGKYFDALYNKLTLLKPLASFLTMPLVSARTLNDFSQHGTKLVPHTRASLDTPTGYTPYDYWKKNFLTRANEDEIKQLHIKLE